MDEEKVWTIEGTSCEEVDGWFADFDFEEEFDTVNDVKEFIKRHDKDLYVSITRVLDPNGDEVDIYDLK